MFTLDLEIAKKACTRCVNDVVMFLVVLDNSRRLPVYTVVDCSLLEVCTNIFIYKSGIVDYLADLNFKYECLVSVSYVS